MHEQLRFVPAASLPLDALAELVTRGFEGYFYPVNPTVAQLAARVRGEQLDLASSVVQLLGDEPAGVALLGLRGAEAWCGGFGVVKHLRGQGLAQPLGVAMIGQARVAGATRLTLEVLTRNDAAVRLYRRLGLAITRDLHVFEWSAGAEQAQRVDMDAAALVARPVRELLERFGAAHPAPAAWQRDLPALLVRPALQGLSSTGRSGPSAYVIVSAGDTGARIEDLGAHDVDGAIGLLRALQGRYTRIVSVNEPADSPITAAYAQCGFREVDRQHEMAMRIQHDLAFVFRS